MLFFSFREDEERNTGAAKLPEEQRSPREQLKIFMANNSSIEDVNVSNESSRDFESKGAQRNECIGSVCSEL